jgi:4'-phosphopantetheinyl transferase
LPLQNHVESRLADAGKLDVVIARLDIGDEAADASAALLSCEERQRAGRFAGDRERRRFTVARARLRQLLGERLAVAPEAVELVYAAGGKPRLHPRFDSDVRFNVSHCQDVAAFAFANGREVGVDVEGVRSLADADAIAALVFSPREHRTYVALDPEQKPRAFFNCWTRKEAFVKALGEGLRHPLHRFDVSLVPGEPARLQRVGSTPGDSCGWALHEFTPGDQMVGAVVVASADG